MWGFRKAWRSRRRGVAARAWFAAGIALAAALSIAGPAAASSGRVIGALPAGTRLRLAVVLKAPHPAALAAFARAVSDPSSPEYRDYLTPGEFGARFGATAEQVRAVVAYLRAHGLSAGSVPADRLSIPVTATAGRVEHAFALNLQRR